MKRKRRRISKRRRKVEKWLTNAFVLPVLAPLGVVASMLLLLLFIPVILPVVTVLSWLESRRKRAAAARFRCTKCGIPLGAVSLQLADAAWGERLQQLHRDNPDVKLRIVRTLDAICPYCGQQYTYLEKERTFVEEAPWQDVQEEA